MTYYKDIRELVDALEKSNLLVRVDHEINKDTWTLLKVGQDIFLHCPPERCELLASKQ